MSQQQPQYEPNQPTKKRRRWLPWTAGAGAFFLGLLIGTSGGGGETASAPQAQPQPGATVTVTLPAEPAETVEVPVPGPTKTIRVTAPPPGPKAVITEDGTYLVGTDIKPGTYKAPGSELCYWARLKTGGDIIDNHLGEGQAVVTIKKTDKAFETTGCGEWKPVR